MLSHDLSRRMSQKQRFWQRMQREKAMQRQRFTHHGRQLAQQVAEATYSTQNRDKIRVMSAHSS